MCDTSPKMEFVATPVKVGSFLNNNNNNNDDDDDTSHDCFEGASSMQEIPQGTEASIDVSIKKVPETATSKVEGTHLYNCHSTYAMEKQPNEDISLSLEENESNKQNDGHKAFENCSPANLQMANVEHFGKEDVKIALEKLDLVSMKGDLRLSRNQSDSLKSTNLMEKQDLPSENDIVSRE
ncbi:hypothetical protein Patl1_18629 [Pistacia atlantica]|uniref:Uncharacterized protein n=1 Tax=Pistacia atlantica TaxID=434234 RepID=A0ACC1BYQ4_9ROSI|nr:hypothetical protein Patl1_18629 [Pistacia atlantica]